jgi:hypothetical protein
MMKIAWGGNAYKPGDGRGEKRREEKRREVVSILVNGRILRLQ